MPPVKIKPAPIPKKTAINTDLMVVTYARVSTDKQGKTKLGLESQRETLDRWIEQNGLTEIEAFNEVESGKKVGNRPELAKALECAKFNGCKLLIPKLDRLARNVHFITGLIESGVRFQALDLPFADVTMIQMFAVFAEYEGRVISERTSAALQALKRRGKKLGGPRGFKPGTIERMREDRNKLFRQAEQVDGAALTAFRELIAQGITMPRVVCRILRRKGITRLSGAPWNRKLVIPFMRRHRLMPINDINKLQDKYNLSESIRKDLWKIRQAELEENPLPRRRKKSEQACLLQMQESDD